MKNLLAALLLLGLFAGCKKTETSPDPVDVVVGTFTVYEVGLNGQNFQLTTTSAVVSGLVVSRDTRANYASFKWQVVNNGAMVINETFGLECRNMVSGKVVGLYENGTQIGEYNNGDLTIAGKDNSGKTFKLRARR